MPRGNGQLKENFSNIFLIAILIGILYLCYILLKPFFIEMGIAAVLVTIFYQCYLKIVFWTKGNITLAALIVSILILLIIIVPFSYLIFYIAQETIILYNSITTAQIVDFLNQQVWLKLNFVDKNIVDIQQLAIDFFASAKNYIIPGATALLSQTIQFIASIFIVAVTMFFLFRDGRSLLRRIMQLTPLSNKYDKLIWMKFRDVSYSTVVATFITSFAQALFAAIAFWIVGLPGLFLGILTFLISFLPYIGTALIWAPIGLYYLIVGDYAKGLLILIWGAFVVSLVDNVLRPYLIKGKAGVHPLIVFFSIFGGMILMGVWGLIFGPLVVALAVTILHIYELEYSKYLDR